MDIIKLETVQDKIIDSRREKVILDSDMAALYGVETKRINEAVKNNQDKFPEGYIFKLTDSEKKEPVENFDQFNKIKHSSADLKAFTEKGVYFVLDWTPVSVLIGHLFRKLLDTRFGFNWTPVIL